MTISDSQIWIVRVPASVALNELSGLVSKKGTMSLKKGSETYALNRANNEEETGDLMALECFISKKNGLVKANNTICYELVPSVALPSMDELKAAGLAIRDAPYIPRVQPKMKAQFQPIGSRKDTAYINKRRKIC